MRKRIIIWVLIILLFLLFHLISGILHNKAEIWLENKLITMLPYGSKIGHIEWNILSTLKADSVFVENFGFIDSVRVQYTPVGYLRRRINNVFLYNPRINLSFPRMGGEGERNIPTLFYIEDLSFINSLIEWQNHTSSLNGSIKLFSTENEIVCDILKIAGSFDGLSFNLENSSVNLDRLGTEIEISSLSVGHSNLKIKGRTDGIIEGEGEIDLRDMNNLWGIDGEGLVGVEFVYDSLLRFNGKSENIYIKGYQLEPISFIGTLDSIGISSSKFRGYFKYDDGITCNFEIDDLNMDEIRRDLPESKLDGTVKFIYNNNDSLRLESTLNGNVTGSSIRDFNVEFEKHGDKIIVENLEGYVNNGKIYFAGEYSDILKGNLFIEKVDISSILKYYGINIQSIASVDINLRERIYGVFSLDSTRYGPIDIGLLNGNIDLHQKDDLLLGELTFVLQKFNLSNREIFSIGEGVVSMGEYDIVLIGLLKRQDKQVEYSIKFDEDKIEVEKLNLTYPGGWLMLDSGFSVEREKDIKVDKAVLKGNKDEEAEFSFNLIEEDIAGNIKLDEFNLRILQEFKLTNLPISGSLSGIFNINGKIYAPRIKFRGKSKSRWKGDFIGDSLNIMFTYSDYNLIIENITLFENSHNSKFSGEIDLNDKLIEIDASFDNAGSWVFYPIDEYIDTRRLEVNGNIQVKGKFPEPQIFGQLEMSKGNLLLVKPGLRIEDLDAVAVFDGDEAILESSRISMSEGIIKAEGVYNIIKKSYDFDIKIDKTPINWQYVNTIVDGDLKFSKTEEITKIEGKIDLSRTVVTMPFRKTGNGGARPKNLYLDIEVDASTGNVWIRNEMADMELLGELGVKYDDGLLLLSGDLSVKHGNFYYLYRTFDVVKGEFKFRNSPEPNPDIDIKAKTIIQEKDTVFLDVSGTMKLPKFELYSKPRRSIADIITLLNLNLSWEDLSSLKAIEESITEAVFNYWVRQTFSRRFKEQFGIDLVEMRGESGHYEIVLGKYITDRLFIKAKTDILSYELAEVQAEYRIRRWGSIIAENDFSGDTRLLFKLGWRY
jgi:hypothetical protein